MATTENRGYPLPDAVKTVKEEFETFAAFTLPMIDLDMQSLFDALGDKAPLNHLHQIEDIPGLTNALAELMPKTKAFALSDLTDVNGSAEAPNGYVLIKTSGEWVAQAALAALGAHGHTIAQVSGLTETLNSKADLTSVVRHDAVQELSTEQKDRAKANMGVVEGTPGDITATELAPAIVAAPSKATPVDADAFAIADSAAGGLLKKLSWANLKAKLKAYFDAIYADISHSHTFGSLTGTPTTRAGYGITDAAPVPSSSALPVGFTCFAGFLSTNSVANGATIAGSALRPLKGFRSVSSEGSNTDGLNIGGIALPGTWRNISGGTISIGSAESSAYTTAGLFVRVA